MATTNGNGRTQCPECPLQRCPGLRPLDPAQVAWLQRFKQGEIRVARGAPVLTEGQRSGEIYTVLEGVLFRYKLLEDGRRQIVNYMFPGDLVGLQAAVAEPLTHSVEALSAATLCVFARDRFPELIRNHPELAFDAIWLAAKEEQALEDHLMTLGQRNARERIAYLALFLLERAMATGLAEGDRVALSVTQTQIGDTLGLSLVHTNRTLQSLRQANLIAWDLNGIRIPDLAAARDFARCDPFPERRRPFL